MFGFKGEVVRNFTAFVLMALGAGLVYRGEVTHLAEVTKTGSGLVGAALLGFQRKTAAEQ